MELSHEKISLCALGRIFGFEPRIPLALIAHTGSAAEIFKLAPDELDRILGPHSRHKGKICSKEFDEAAMSLERLYSDGVRFTGWTEDGYPPLLKECPDAPAGLYIRSRDNDGCLWNGDAISVVGTRDISPYGREWCEKIVSYLAESCPGICIISGLAIGIDICAHMAAMHSGLPTIAVMATGTDKIYPHRNSGHAGRMAAAPGCALVTDFPPGTVPLPVNFLRRNRIIAGLARATVIVESKEKGGAMMTARLAFSYDREVFALPGRADDIRSRGCNRLLRERIAEPLTSPEELAESLGLNAPGKTKPVNHEERVMEFYRSRGQEDDAIQMAGIISAIRSECGITVGQISETTGLSYGKTAALAGILEADGFITTDLLRRCSLAHSKFR